MSKAQNSAVLEQDGYDAVELAPEAQEGMFALQSDTLLDAVTVEVTLAGIVPLMFDRYPGENTTQLQWNQKMYLAPSTNKLCLPTENIRSLLCSVNSNSAPKVLRDPRKYKKLCLALAAYTILLGEPEDPMNIYIRRNNQPILTGKFTESRDPVSGLYLHRATARLEKGIPNPKVRPVLPLPWSLTFRLCILPNRDVKEAEVHNLLSDAGIPIGLGTFRPTFGKYRVAGWKRISG